MQGGLIATPTSSSGHAGSSMWLLASASSSWWGKLWVSERWVNTLPCMAPLVSFCAVGAGVGQAGHLVLPWDAHMLGSGWGSPIHTTGGYLAHSLAILTDAAHLLTDFASIMISLFALWVSSRPATKTMNFGWHRAEILGALLSVLSIWVVTGVLVYLAAQRLLLGDYDIEGSVMLITSACAVAVNIVMGVALHQTGHGHSHGGAHEQPHTHEQPNASVRAAFVHVVGDLLQSVGVLIASYIIFFKPEYKFVDPICTFLFSVLVLGTTLTILRDVLLVLMEGTPRGMDFNAVRDTLLAVGGVEAVHSLHIWALTASQPLLSVHIAINADADSQEVLEEASSRLQRAFRFHTTTIQIESYSEDMRDCRECQPPSD
uniref:Solute carrier family 30 member 2 n=1 Tax=Coturnix japonica TaxID=93934 RepID=A0A8C2YEB2_COTJA